MLPERHRMIGHVRICAGAHGSCVHADLLPAAAAQLCLQAALCARVIQQRPGPRECHSVASGAGPHHCGGGSQGMAAWRSCSLLSLSSARFLSCKQMTEGHRMSGIGGGESLALHCARLLLHDRGCVRMRKAATHPCVGSLQLGQHFHCEVQMLVNLPPDTHLETNVHTVPLEGLDRSIADSGTSVTRRLAALASGLTGT